MAAGGHLPLLHGLQQGGLRLRRRPVDLVGQDQIGEQRPRDEPQLARAGGPVLVQDLGPGDVAGHQVGRELDPVEFQRERLRQRVDHQRLGQSGHPFEDAMAPGEDGDQELIDDLVLADDLPGDLLADLPVDAPQFVEFGQVEFGSVAVLNVTSPFSRIYRWKTGRYLKGSWRMMTAIEVP